MRYIVDSNFLQSEELVKILLNPVNEVLLCDQVSLEALRSDMVKSFEVISRFPNQVHVLKRSQKIMRQSLKSKGLQKRLIDENDTKRFRKRCKQIHNLYRRDDYFHNQNKLMKQDSINELAQIRQAIDQMNEYIINYFSELTKEQRKVLRKDPPFEPDALKLIMDRLLDMTWNLFSNVVDFKNRNNHETFYNSYLFRAGVCQYFLIQDLFLSGGLENMKSKKLLNDILDMQIAGYATYFDGFLTNDRKAQRIYKISKYFIDGVISAKYA